MADYGTVEYWEERYKKDANPYDWYQRWENMSSIIKDYLKTDDKILVIGNGTSRLPEEMYDEGFQNIEAMDISNVAVEIMHERFASRNIKCQVSDVLSMYQYTDNDYDVVIDKGTFDTILCGENSHLNIDKMMKELIRILSYNKGRYICISYGQPNYRLNYLKSMKEWEVTTIPIKKPANDQIYKLKNYNEIDADSQENNSISTTTRPDLYHYIYICTLINKVIPTITNEYKFDQVIQDYNQSKNNQINEINNEVSESNIENQQFIQNNDQILGNDSNNQD